MRYLLIAIVVVGLAAVLTACGRRKPSQSETPSFRMRVENVFFIKGIDRVVVTGVVSSGVVRAGDQLLVKTGTGSIPVTVEKLEHPKLALSEARSGQDVALMLIGIEKHQVTTGDELVSTQEVANN